jgi:hypothetical protein
MTASAKHRVAVWATGWIGTIAIRTIHRRPDLELDGIREYFDREPTDRTLEVACGTIEAGTCGAPTSSAP